MKYSTSGSSSRQVPNPLGPLQRDWSKYTFCKSRRTRFASFSGKRIALLDQFALLTARQKISERGPYNLRIEMGTPLFSYRIKELIEFVPIKKKKKFSL